MDVSKEYRRGSSEPGFLHGMCSRICARAGLGQGVILSCKDFRAYGRSSRFCARGLSGGVF